MSIVGGSLEVTGSVWGGVEKQCKVRVRNYRGSKVENASKNGHFKRPPPRKVENSASDGASMDVYNRTA